MDAGLADSTVLMRCTCVEQRLAVLQVVCAPDVQLSERKEEALLFRLATDEDSKAPRRIASPLRSGALEQVFRKCACPTSLQ